MTMNNFMTPFTEWDHVKPIFFSITLVVMIICGLMQSAFKAFEGFYGGQSSISNSYRDGHVSFSPFRKHRTVFNSIFLFLTWVSLTPLLFEIFCFFRIIPIPFFLPSSFFFKISMISLPNPSSFFFNISVIPIFIVYPYFFAMILSHLLSNDFLARLTTIIPFIFLAMIYAKFVNRLRLLASGALLEEGFHSRHQEYENPPKDKPAIGSFDEHDCIKIVDQNGNDQTANGMPADNGELFRKRTIERIKHGGAPFENPPCGYNINSLRRGPFTAVVRAAGVVTHACGSLYGGLGFLLRFLSLLCRLDFIMRIWSVLQIKLHSAKNFAINRAPVLFSAILNGFEQSRFIVETNCYPIHVTIVNLCGYFVNPLILQGAA